MMPPPTSADSLGVAAELLAVGRDLSLLVADLGHEILQAHVEHLIDAPVERGHLVSRRRARDRGSTRSARPSARSSADSCERTRTSRSCSRRSTSSYCLRSSRAACMSASSTPTDIARVVEILAHAIALIALGVDLADGAVDLRLRARLLHRPAASWRPRPGRTCASPTAEARMPLSSVCSSVTRLSSSLNCPRAVCWRSSIDSAFTGSAAAAAPARRAPPRAP